jgi:hypothetical protein
MMEMKGVLGVVLLAVALAGCGGQGHQASSSEDASKDAGPTALEQASSDCGGKPVGNPLLTRGLKTKAAKFLTVEDDGQTLIVGGGDQYDTAQAGFCVLEELDAPASTVSLVESTNSTMGRQTDSWDGFEASWSYHPDSGLDMTIEQLGS